MADVVGVQARGVRGQIRRYRVEDGLEFSTLGVALTDARSVGLVDPHVTQGIRRDDMQTQPESIRLHDCSDNRQFGVRFGPRHDAYRAKAASCNQAAPQLERPQHGLHLTDPRKNIQVAENRRVRRNCWIEDSDGYADLINAGLCRRFHRQNEECNGDHCQRRTTRQSSSSPVLQTRFMLSVSMQLYSGGSRSNFL